MTEPLEVHGHPVTFSPALLCLPRERLTDERHQRRLPHGEDRPVPPTVQAGHDLPGILRRAPRRSQGHMIQQQAAFSLVHQDAGQVQGQGGGQRAGLRQGVPAGLEGPVEAGRLLTEHR